MFAFLKAFLKAKASKLIWIALIGIVGVTFVVLQSGILEKHRHVSAKLKYINSWDKVMNASLPYINLRIKNDGDLPIDNLIVKFSIALTPSTSMNGTSFYSTTLSQTQGITDCSFVQKKSSEYSLDFIYNCGSINPGEVLEFVSSHLSNTEDREGINFIFLLYLKGNGISKKFSGWGDDDFTEEREDRL